MSAMASQITGVSIVCWGVCSGAGQRKHQSSVSLAFVRGIHRWLVNSSHIRPVTWKMFPFGDGRHHESCLFYHSRRTASRLRPLSEVVSTERFHGPLTRYVKLRVAHAPRMAGTFYPPPQVSASVMHYGTCVIHVPWCMPGSLTSGFLWGWWRGKRSRHSRRMRNPQFYVSGKRPIVCYFFALQAESRQLPGTLGERHRMRRLWGKRNLYRKPLWWGIVDLCWPKKQCRRSADDTV